jgi:hypothetical protein
MTVPRAACRTIRRNVLQIGNAQVFLASMTIPSACNKSFRKKKSQQSDKIGITPVGDYTNNMMPSKAIARFIFEEQENPIREEN